MKKVFLFLCVGAVGLCAVAFAQSAASIAPHEVIQLFNGKDLSNFTTWESKHGKADPDGVFTVVDCIDGAPAIRSSGKHYGGIITKNSYRDYVLVVEFRWGLVTWDRRRDRARDSGILLHCQGEEGNAAKTFDNPWMRSIEFQIIEGGTGDVILVTGYDRGNAAIIAPTLKVRVTEGTRRWNPEGVWTDFNEGRIDWLRRDPSWKDVLGFRGKAEAEKPAGEWNRLEAICRGGDIDYFVNGEKVMEGRGSNFKEGRILLQSEGAEIFFRKVELHPLKP